jgi:hypothetical protein
MVGIRQALLITRGPPPYRGLYHVEVESVSGSGSFVDEDGSQGVVWSGSGAEPEPEAMSGNVSESWSVDVEAES